MRSRPGLRPKGRSTGGSGVPCQAVRSGAGVVTQGGGQIGGVSITANCIIGVMLTKYATIGSLLLMNKSTNNLSNVLAELTQAARARGLNDSDWAARAGLRKETLSRLRRRQSCGFTTLLALANAVEMRLSAVSDALPTLSPDGHFPDGLDREYEERLLTLCASRSLSPQHWSTLGPGFFMAGLGRDDRQR